MNITNKCPVCKKSNYEELGRIKWESTWVIIMLCPCGNIYYYLGV